MYHKIAVSVALKGNGYLNVDCKFGLENGGFQSAGKECTSGTSSHGCRLGRKVTYTILEVYSGVRYGYLT